MLSGLPPVFQAWFTKSQRLWLAQFIDEYVASIKANVPVPFVMGVTEQFVDTYPLRRTCTLDVTPHTVRLTTLRIRIRAYFAFVDIDTAADWDSKARQRY
ncbi:hypothetical protein EST38_g11303 [Candolleomyces aberdarensis]|uniref:Uncharacterized protein n=1 Tax=Candolleomyces aberdarensis TaxID=2316362 RepID=A0A4Q2D5V0_9AGAR|nr:hypothetical protein EST38_g11303 [Candolleomyces aberdarensis]